MVFSISGSFAQQDTVFFNRKYKSCERKNASYYALITKVDDNHYKATEYFMDRRFRSEYTLSSVAPWVKEGKVVLNYKGGQKQCEGYYHNDKRDSLWTWWNKNGKMDAQVMYKSDGTYETLFPPPAKPDSLFDSRVILKMAPLSMIDPYSGSSLRLGTEFKLRNNFAGYIECGGYFPWGSTYADSRNSGFTAKLEFKYYLNRKQYCGGDYLSLELFNKYQSYRASDTIALNQPGTIQKYTVYKDITCLTFKWGHTKLWGKNFVTDAFIGVGARYHSAVNSLTPLENSKLKPYGDYGLNVAENGAGNYWFLNVDMGIKIGYRIK